MPFACQPGAITVVKGMENEPGVLFRGQPPAFPCAVFHRTLSFWPGFGGHGRRIVAFPHYPLDGLQVLKNANCACARRPNHKQKRPPLGGPFVFI
jgi:hypothetical protein